MIILAQAGVEALGGGGIVGLIYVLYRLLERYGFEPRDRKKNGVPPPTITSISDDQLHQLQNTYKYAKKASEQVNDLHEDIRDPHKGMVVAMGAIAGHVKDMSADLKDLTSVLREQNGKR